MTKELLICTIIGLFLWASSVHGETDPHKSNRSYRGNLFDIPVYDPASKSYFKLMHVPKAYYKPALAFAKSQSFNGTRGRLAIIRSRETQAFIDRVIRPPNEAWIGLRMSCRPRKLHWVDGTILNRAKDYTNWGRKWHYDDKYLPCKGGPNTINGKYAGIALRRHNGRIRWWAIAPRHETNLLLIEFPTGKR